MNATTDATQSTSTQSIGKAGSRDGLGKLSHDGMADVVIVSIYGRGNWLATELAQRGWKVTLVDVSEKLGAWDPIDAEGPFGFFESADLLPSQVSRFDVEGEAVLAERGFVLWLPEGPIEFRGDMTTFFAQTLRDRGLTEDVEKYLRLAAVPTKESERERKVIARKPFEAVWLAHFAHQLASNRYHENHEGLNGSVPLPLFNPFSFRRSTTDGWAKSLKACRTAGLVVRSRAHVKDARVSGRMMDAIEIEDERAGVERGRSFVWMLSSGETEKLGRHLRDVLFPRGHVEAEWLWARYEYDLTGKIHADQVPGFAVMMDDVLLPWTHSNMMVFRTRAAEARQVDVWARVPAWARFDRSYHVTLAEEIRQKLAKRLPHSKPVLTALPLDVRGADESGQVPEKTRDEMGPPRQPVYSEHLLSSLSHLKASNLFFDGPEQGESIDWLGQFRRQRDLLEQLEKLKAQWDEAARKAAALDETKRGRSPSP